jgi:rubrerythrin
MGKRRWELSGKQRADFTLALERSRCPRDGGHVLEVSMPEVVCETCSTFYILAIQPGALPMRWKLVEKQTSQQLTVSEGVTQSLIVKMPCKYCGHMNDVAATRYCPSCGTRVK